MPNSDYYADITPQNTFDIPDKPTVTQLKAALTAYNSTSYPVATLNLMSLRDLWYACRYHGLTVAVSQGV